MSKYEWESGSIKLPTKAWKPVRDALVTAYNQQQDRLSELAQKVHARLVHMGWTPGHQLHHSMDAALRSEPEGRLLLQRFQEEDHWLLGMALVKGDEKGSRKLVKPTKSAFAHLAVSKAESLTCGEASITFQHKQRSMTWAVSDNNHAVDRARESWLGRAFFSILRSVEWTRGTGGTICGNDENNRDQRDEGGGANYVTARFGPLGKDKDLARILAKRNKRARSASSARAIRSTP